MQQRDAELLRALYENYLVPLKKYAVSIGVDCDYIEDMVHETFLEYYARYSLELGDRQKRILLTMILRCRWIDYCRKNKRCRAFGAYDRLEIMTAFETLLDHDTLHYVMENDIYRQIRELVEGMKKDWRDVLILYVLEGRTIRDTSQILGIAETVCRSRVFRARQELKRLLENENIFDINSCTHESDP